MLVCENCGSDTPARYVCPCMGCKRKVCIECYEVQAARHVYRGSAA